MQNVVVSFLALGLVACGSAATDEDYDEVAAGLGALTASENGGGDVRSMRDSVVLLRGEVPFGLTADARGSFEGLHGGLRYSYTLTCRDEAAVLSACDASTSSGRLQVSWSGDLVTPFFSGSLARSGDWRVSGLQTNVATFDGAGAFEVRAAWTTLRGSRRSYELSYEAQYFAIGFETAAEGRVVRGSARFDVHAHRMLDLGGDHTEAEFDMEAMVTFEADGRATLILDGAHRYSLDVSTGAVARLER